MTSEDFKDKDIARLTTLLRQAESRAQTRERAAFEAGFHAEQDYLKGPYQWRFNTYFPSDKESAAAAFKAWRLHLEAQGIKASLDAGREP